jgi:hypothetical protein
MLSNFEDRKEATDSCLDPVAVQTTKESREQSLVAVRRERHVATRPHVLVSMATDGATKQMTKAMIRVNRRR